MKILELFSGYGTASFALKQLGIPYECVGYSDIDKYANQCFQQNHGGKELGDVTKINPKDLEDFDLLTGGFPCQTFSVAGKGLGELDTRGTLFNEIIRIAEVKKPKYMMLENVKGLTFKKHKSTFDKIISELYRIGYFVKWKILNTKNYGIPQNRERIFFVCFKSWTDFCNFEWPEKEELKLLLGDILEKNVDDKYYLNEEQVKRLLKYERSFNERVFNEEISNIICSRDYKVPKIVYYQCDPKQKHHNSQMDRIYSTNGLSPTLHLRSKDIKILLNKAIMDGYTIRKITPIECFRLQGFLNDEINLDGLPDTQRYKLAGNGQSVNVVKKIFEQMFLKGDNK